MLKLIKQARAAFSLLSPDEVRNRAHQPITFGLVATDGRGYQEMESLLIPEAAPEPLRANLKTMVHRAGDPGVPNKVDLVLYEDGVPGPRGTYVFHRGNPERTMLEIVRDNDDIALALARQYPAFRKIVVERIIQSVARENAFFAIATALPDVIPSLMELPWAFGEFASDTVFLTVNQIRMAFLIAAASNKEIGFAQQKAEIAGIAASAFGWRAIARELVGKIPFGGGLIPKGAVAYAVTFAIGKGLEHMHHANVPFTHAQHRQAYLEAYEQGKSVAESIADRARLPEPRP
jgi:uncharacterized protein (DUF697 family)